MKAPGLLVLFIGYPPFVYAAGVLLSNLDAGDLAVVILAYLLVAAVGIYGFLSPYVGTWAAAFVYLGIGVVILAVAFAPATAGNVGFDVALGGLAAGPLVALLSFCQPHEGLGTRIVGLQVALIDGLLLLATHAVASPNTTPSGLVGGYFTTIGQQASGIFDLIVQQGNVVAPAGTVFDAWYVALASLPVLAIFLTFLHPATGRGVPLPMQDALPEGADRADVPLTEPFRELLRTRSPVRAAPAARIPGLRPFAGAAALTALYVVSGYYAPAATLPLTGLVVLLGVIAMVVVLRRPIEAAVPVARATPAPVTGSGSTGT